MLLWYLNFILQDNYGTFEENGECASFSPSLDFFLYGVSQI